MKTPAIVLTIAGSDSSGGAGIQADIKAISALGSYAASVITSVTAQNTLGVQGIHPIPTDMVRQQIESVMEDLHPEAIKIGMVCDKDIAHTIAECIRKYHPKWVVYDPVMVSTSGYNRRHSKRTSSACQPQHAQSARGTHPFGTRSHMHRGDGKGSHDFRKEIRMLGTDQGRTSGGRGHVRRIVRLH